MRRLWWLRRWNVTADNVPALGVGFSFRRPYITDLFLNPRTMDFLEILSDHYLEEIPERAEELELLHAHYTLIPHSLNLSLGGADALDGRYVRRLCSLIRRLEPPWFSDHLAFSRAGGIELGHLAPISLTREALSVVCRHVHEVQDRAETLLILENITAPMELPGAEMSEAEFLNEVVNRTGCGLLLDLTNIYTNSVNHGYSAQEHLEQYPLDQVVQLHIAGGEWSHGALQDTHSTAVPEEVWQLLEWTLGHRQIAGVILERDEKLPTFTSVVAETDSARSVWQKYASR